MSKAQEAAMRTLVGAVALAAATAQLAAGQWREVKPEEEPALFRTDVNLVRVDAEVLLGGRAILGLNKVDFQVFDNASPREITHFMHEQAPLDVLLIFDVSGSMRPVVERVAESATQALAQLRDGDRVGVMIFTTRTRVIQPLTKDIDRVVAAIESQVLTQPFQGGTHLLDAIADGATEFMREKPADRRRAIVVITDNKGQRTRSDDSVIRLLWEADATASGLIVDSPELLSGGGGPISTGPISLPWPRRRTGGVNWPPIGGGGPIISLMATMNKVAEESGGDIVSTNTPGQAFAELIERLRGRYNIFYSMPEGTAGERRQVRVELAGQARSKYPGVQIRARKGYVIPGPASSHTSRLTNPL